MSKTLGRGLSSLIPTGNRKSDDLTVGEGNVEDISWLEGATYKQKVLEISPDDISPNPHQPRQNFQEEALFDLMESIKEHGIIQPLIVTRDKHDKYELVAGERRLRAAQKLHLRSVPAIVRSSGELEKLEIAIIENIQRQDLNPIERAHAYRKLIDEFSLTHEQAAKRMGKSRSAISNNLRLLELPDDVKSLISTGKLSETLAIAVLEISDPEQQKKFAQQIVDQHLTKQEARRIIRQSGYRKSKERGKSDPVLRGYEDKLQAALGTRVKVGKRGKSGWLIEIEAYSEEELESVIRKITHG